MKTKQNLLIFTLIASMVLLIAGSCKKNDDNNINPVNTFTDIRDGNVYKIVTIGDQVWMAENLRYSGNIPQVNESSAWEAIHWNGTEEPAWCYYDNNPANDEIYGKLYNWYAVNTGTLCPPGWHIPTEAEWSQLTDVLGGANVAGGKMKTITGWDSPNIEANNESGFSGFPGGIRWSSGDFISMGKKGGLWSSTDTEGEAMTLHLAHFESIARTIWDSKTHGYSCRCLRD